MGRCRGLDAVITVVVPRMKPAITIFSPVLKGARADIRQFRAAVP